MQFLAVGAVLFLGSQWLGERRAMAEETIVVDAARVQRLAELYRVQTGALPSSEETEHLIETFVRDEILYREALRLGLDKDDEIVRRRLSQKMEFLSSDLVVVPEASESDLRALYERQASRFARPAVATFSHVFFSVDGRGDADAELLATRTLAGMAGGLHGMASAHDGAFQGQGGGRGDRAAPVGDPFPLQSSYADLSEDETSQIFGRSEFTRAVFAAPEGQWTGPVRSGYGWHLVRVGARQSESVLPFEQVRAEVQKAWREGFLHAANEQHLAGLRERYTVVRDIPEKR